MTQTAVQLSHESSTLLDGLFGSLTALLRTRAGHSHRPPPSAAALADAAALANGPGALVVPLAERERRAQEKQRAHADDARRILRLLAEQEGRKPTLSVRAAYDELKTLPPPASSVGPSSSAAGGAAAGQSTTPPPTTTAPGGLSASVSGKPKGVAGGLAPVTPRKGTATPRKGTGTTPFRSRTPSAPQAE